MDQVEGDIHSLHGGSEGISIQDISFVYFYILRHTRPKKLRTSREASKGVASTSEPCKQASTHVAGGTRDEEPHG
jgi:hypothetical protein